MVEGELSDAYMAELKRKLVNNECVPLEKDTYYHPMRFREVRGIYTSSAVRYFADALKMIVLMLPNADFYGHDLRTIRRQTSICYKLLVEVIQNIDIDDDLLKYLLDAADFSHSFMATFELYKKYPDNEFCKGAYIEMCRLFLNADGLKKKYKHFNNERNTYYTFPQSIYDGVLFLEDIYKRFSKEEFYEIFKDKIAYSYSCGAVNNIVATYTAFLEKNISIIRLDKRLHYYPVWQNFRLVTTHGGIEYNDAIIKLCDEEYKADQSKASIGKTNIPCAFWYFYKTNQEKELEKIYQYTGKSLSEYYGEFTKDERYVPHVYYQDLPISTDFLLDRDQALSYMRRSGWYSGRKTDISKVKEHYVSYGFKLFPAAEKFFEEFYENPLSVHYTGMEKVISMIPLPDAYQEDIGRYVYYTKESESMYDDMDDFEEPYSYDEDLKVYEVDEDALARQNKRRFYNANKIRGAGKNKLIGKKILSHKENLDNAVLYETIDSFCYEVYSYYYINIAKEIKCAVLPVVDLNMGYLLWIAEDGRLIITSHRTSLIWVFKDIFHYVRM